jgi:hypothetical protein
LGTQQRRAKFHNTHELFFLVQFTTQVFALYQSTSQLVSFRGRSSPFTSSLSSEYGLTLPRSRTFTMPRRGKKRAKGNGNNAKSLDVADLSSPLQFLDLDTPASTSSLTVSPSDFTPVPSSSVPTAVMNPRGMDPHDEMHLSEGPPADVHSKLGKPSLRYSATNSVGSFHGAFSSSKMLQQVLGIQPPEPYPCPPFRPEDLEKSFFAGMKWHGLNVEVPGEDPLETIRRAAAATEQQETPTVQDYGKHTLDVIEEEQESPARSMHNKAARSPRPTWSTMNRTGIFTAIPVNPDRRSASLTNSTQHLTRLPLSPTANRLAPAPQHWSSEIAPPARTQIRQTRHR